VSPRLTVVAHSSTSATVSARFSRDEPLDDRGAAWASDARGRLTRVHRVFCSPALACRQTAAALDLVVGVEPQLRDWDLGRWRGQTLDEVAAAEPDAVRRWLADPAEAPHGGEPLTAVLARTADWLATVPGDGHSIAITHSAIVRAAILATLDAPPGGFWRIDVAPLTATVLRGGPGRWTLRSTGHPLRSREL
jgi:broad specificity phosphatase PhoE